MGEVKKDEVVDRFETYEEYLNMFITEEDMLYLGEEEIARNVDIIKTESNKKLQIFDSLFLIKFNRFSFINFPGSLIVELGYRSSGTLSREKFFQTKAELAAARNINNKPGVDGDNGEENDGRE